MWFCVWLWGENWSERDISQYNLSFLKKKNFCDPKHLVVLRITRDVFLNLFFFSLDSKGSCNQKWMSTNVKITTRGDNTGKIIFICQKKKKKNFHPHLLDTPALVAETNSLWLPCDGNREAAVPPRGTRATCQWRCSEILFFAYSKLTKPIFMDHSSDVEHM